MGSYNFKSAGQTTQQQQDNKLATTAIPIGIKTPLRPGQTQGIFAVNTDLSSQIADNLRNLILTNWGERVLLYDFGANLRPLMTEFTTQDDFDAAAVERISGAVRRWMPYVSLNDYESKVDHLQNKNTGIIRLKVTYDIPSINVTNAAIEVVLYVI